MNKKYYICLNGDGELLTLYQDSDIDFFAQQNNGNRNPFQLFSGVIEEEIVTDIFVCELTNQGLIYKKRLNSNLEEVDL